ncbi:MULTISPECIES: type II toxin-antitoxin system RelE/ParE family toxin [Pectobacterium]|uniref:Plasmid stabilization system n=1 Tax=Pectobacterium carotovorum subsp. carotovorum (strain PC1) TaxID=561230 RepID=C6DE37_PECCP|nr:type II toxin-antitoxin system RelE/ParE family toxin [Pectobacterium carotovorum]ACT14473.1 plasmid stabilization system [Pectobacterium carotovorum subsp. carotovorum PC1]
MNSCKKSETGREQPPDKIKLTPLAQHDLEAIYLYGLLHFNQERAEAYLETIEHAFTAIRHNKIGIERKELGPGLYSFPVARHTLFFLYETDSVIVVRILHHSQDIVRHLKWL